MLRLYMSNSRARTTLLSGLLLGVSLLGVFFALTQIERDQRSISAASQVSIQPE